MRQDLTQTIDRIMSAYPGAGRDALIPILQDTQEDIGYLPREAVVLIGDKLHLPVSKIFGVATFYNQFRFEPKGRFHIQVCRGTACHVKGSLKVLERIKRELGIESGRTTRDGLFSLEIVACIGACALAPVMSINGEVHGRLTTDDVVRLIKDCRKAAETGEAR
ncbi:MAG TPA: NADH-quinone oxidoreductase subunit NuoE [Candidatus Fermentibacter daniensis]|jgi:NADH-quinone oxidoreductase subunit E|nr:MAG: NADH dehydrogenase [Candidatus Fermentibacter daniensis]MBP7720834.1 NADH-quinone oxidoreductase subunit NuoE [Candidatus Fermentibacter sp.]KZD16990.1 MAG: NADH dehydrogenase [Candidatus Fermentibacter daniensis]KZD20022.1 MAG: NADH dehydrogenase [Candidatus Fermentibacter daniensis]MCC6872505.1 NADH-quinone oxidoreductase subunit NuoE [Candidatus Fermentibacter sp.]